MATEPKDDRGGSKYTNTKDKPLPDFEPIIEQRGAKITFSQKFKRNVVVLLHKGKSGEYDIENWFASKLIKLRSYYGYDDNRSTSRLAQSVNTIIQHAKVGNKQTAQKLLDNLTESEFNLYSKKYSKDFDRSFIRNKKS